MAKITIRVQEKELYDRLLRDIKTLWYYKTGESLSNGNALVKSMLYFRHELAKYSNQYDLPVAGNEIHIYEWLQK